jgi:uncharacterized protein YndB with AHSA1/START domain
MSDAQPELKITRYILAPQQVVFDAWTTAESMKEWMCPEGTTASFVELDLRVGGSFRINMHIAGMEDLLHTGVYREILPPEKLVFTWVSQHTHFQASLVTVEFRAQGDTTELVLTQQQLPDEEARRLHVDGWTTILGHLATWLAQQQGYGL